MVRPLPVETSCGCRRREIHGEDLVAAVGRPGGLEDQLIAVEGEVGLGVLAAVGEHGEVGEVGSRRGRIEDPRDVRGDGRAGSGPGPAVRGLSGHTRRPAGRERDVGAIDVRFNFIVPPNGGMVSWTGSRWQIRDTNQEQIGSSGIVSTVTRLSGQGIRRRESFRPSERGERAEEYWRRLLVMVRLEPPPRSLGSLRALGMNPHTHYASPSGLVLPSGSKLHRVSDELRVRTFSQLRVQPSNANNKVVPATA